MNDTELYKHLLGIKTPWVVHRVDLSMAEQRVTVDVVLEKPQAWADPTNECAHVIGWSECEWRYLDTSQFETIIKARVPHLEYSNGMVEQLTVPWAELYSRVPFKTRPSRIRRKRS